MFFAIAVVAFLIWPEFFITLIGYAIAILFGLAVLGAIGYGLLALWNMGGWWSALAVFLALSLCGTASTRTI